MRIARGSAFRQRPAAGAGDGAGAAELQGFLDRGGFEAVKMRVGAGDGTLDHSIRRVHAARDGLGAAVDIM